MDPDKIVSRFKHHHNILRLLIRASQSRTYEDQAKLTDAILDLSAQEIEHLQTGQRVAHVFLAYLMKKAGVDRITLKKDEYTDFAMQYHVHERASTDPESITFELCQEATVLSLERMLKEIFGIDPANKPANPANN